MNFKKWVLDLNDHLQLTQFFQKNTDLSYSPMYNYSDDLKMSYAIRYPNKQEIKISNSKINKYKEKKHNFTKEEVLSPKLMVTLFCHKKKIQYISQCIISQLTQQKSYM